MVESNVRINNVEELDIVLYNGIPAVVMFGEYKCSKDYMTDHEKTYMGLYLRVNGESIPLEKRDYTKIGAIKIEDNSSGICAVNKPDDKRIDDIMKNYVIRI